MTEYDQFTTETEIEERASFLIVCQLMNEDEAYEQARKEVEES